MASSSSFSHVSFEEELNKLRERCWGKDATSGPVIGIDLGTTFSTVVAVVGEGLQPIRSGADGDSIASFITSVGSNGTVFWYCLDSSLCGSHLCKIVYDCG